MPSKARSVHTGSSEIRRTSLNLDFDLVAKARVVLGTAGTTETVHRALEQAVLREGRRRAASLRFDDAAVDAIEQARRWRG
jgi:Arc/MetJ family transcription regulator